MVHAILVQDARHSCCFMYDTYKFHLQIHTSTWEILLLLQYADTLHRDYACNLPYCPLHQSHVRSLVYLFESPQFVHQT